MRVCPHAEHGRPGGNRGGCNSRRRHGTHTGRSDWAKKHGRVCPQDAQVLTGGSHARAYLPRMQVRHNSPSDRVGSHGLTRPHRGQRITTRGGGIDRGRARLWHESHSG